MDTAQLKQVYENLFGRPMVLEKKCDTEVCFWLVVDLHRFSVQSKVYVDARPEGGKAPRRHRPFLTAGKTNANEFRVLLLTAEERRFPVSVTPCNEFCLEFPLKRQSYVFEWSRGATVVLLPAGIIRDKEMVKFCGSCPDSSILPQGVLNVAFVP